MMPPAVEKHRPWRIGDSLEPRLILGAIASGAKVGNSI